MSNVERTLTKDNVWQTSESLDVLRTDFTSVALVREAKGGSREAFHHLAQMYLTFMSRQAAKYVSNSDIEDVVQEALLRAYRGIAAYREEGQFEFWLRKIVTRSALDFWRKTRRKDRTVKAFQNEFGEDSSAVSGDAGLRVDLNRCLDELGSEDRMVCVMAFLEERSHKEIADSLGISVVAVKVRCFRLRAKLQKWFEV